MKLLKQKNLSDVLAGFQKTLADLDRLIAKNLQKQSRNVETINALHEENRSIEAEVAKAAKVRVNISQLIEE